jgi:16S rRNA (cytosine967-C5)-methyltransferase
VRPVHSAREAALQTLHQVEVAGAYAHVYLPRLLAASGLSRQERALATELAYGTLRRRATLDYRVAQVCHRPLAQLSPWIRNLLRLGAYELLFLNRTSPAATCHSLVQLAHRYGHAGSARLANAVLRRLSDPPKALDLPDPTVAPVDYLSIAYSLPRWLVERWLQRWPQEVEALCAAQNEPAPVTVRVNLLRTRPADLAMRWEAAGLRVTACQWAPEGLTVESRGPIQELPGYAEGLFWVQDEASLLVGRLAAPPRGALVVDLCSAPGAKATHLAELMGDRGAVIALDLHQPRLRLVASAASRLGLRSVIPVCADGRRVPDLLREPAAVVVVDAPCSGTGALRRRPDARWRKQPEQIAALAALQGELLQAAAQVVRPGGRLIYSTCSLEPEENEEVIRQFRQVRPDFVPDLPPLGPGLEGDEAEGWVRLWPHRHGTDGFFICRLRRR